MPACCSGSAPVERRPEPRPHPPSSSSSWLHGINATCFKRRARWLAARELERRVAGGFDLEASVDNLPRLGSWRRPTVMGRKTMRVRVLRPSVVPPFPACAAPLPLHQPPPQLNILNRIHMLGRTKCRHSPRHLLQLPIS